MFDCKTVYQFVVIAEYFWSSISASAYFPFQHQHIYLFIPSQALLRTVMVSIVGITWQVAELKTFQEEAEIERQKLLNDALTVQLKKVKRDQDSAGGVFFLFISSSPSNVYGAVLCLSTK